MLQKYPKTSLVLTIFIVVLIVILYMYYSYEIEHECQFCGKIAKWNRTPKIEALATYKKYDMDLSYAELQDVFCCDECMSIAGGFRTTKWKCIRECSLNDKEKEI